MTSLATPRTDVLVVGSGFAGAALAFHLSREYSGRIDTWALLTFYLAGARSRGAEIVYDCAVRAIDAGAARGGGGN